MTAQPGLPLPAPPKRQELEASQEVEILAISYIWKRLAPSLIET